MQIEPRWNTRTSRKESGNPIRIQVRHRDLSVECTINQQKCYRKARPRAPRHASGRVFPRPRLHLQYSHRLTRSYPTFNYSSSAAIRGTSYTQLSIIRCASFTSLSMQPSQMYKIYVIIWHSTIRCASFTSSSDHQRYKIKGGDRRWHTEERVPSFNREKGYIMT